MGGANGAAAERELRAAIAARLKAARVDAGMTQQVAADRIGMGRSALSDVERGLRSVRARELVGFAQLYAVGLDVLLEGRERAAGQELAGLYAGLSPTDRATVLALARFLHHRAVVGRGGTTGRRP